MPTCPIPINNETFRLVDEVKLWRGSMDEATDSSALAQVKLSGMQQCSHFRHLSIRWPCQRAAWFEHRHGRHWQRPGPFLKCFASWCSQRLWHHLHMHWQHCHVMQCLCQNGNGIRATGWWLVISAASSIARHQARCGINAIQHTIKSTMVNSSIES